MENSVETKTNLENSRKFNSTRTGEKENSTENEGILNATKFVIENEIPNIVKNKGSVNTQNMKTNNILHAVEKYYRVCANATTHIPAAGDIACISCKRPSLPNDFCCGSSKPESKNRPMGFDSKEQTNPSTLGPPGKSCAGYHDKRSNPKCPCGK